MGVSCLASLYYFIPWLLAWPREERNRHSLKKTKENVKEEKENEERKRKREGTRTRRKVRCVGGLVGWLVGKRRQVL